MAHLRRRRESGSLERRRSRAPSLSLSLSLSGSPWSRRRSESRAAGARPAHLPRRERPDASERARRRSRRALVFARSLSLEYVSSRRFGAERVCRTLSLRDRWVFLPPAARWPAVRSLARWALTPVSWSPALGAFTAAHFMGPVNVAVAHASAERLGFAEGYRFADRHLLPGHASPLSLAGLAKRPESRRSVPTKHRSRATDTRGANSRARAAQHRLERMIRGRE